MSSSSESEFNSSIESDEEGRAEREVEELLNELRKELFYDEKIEQLRVLIQLDHNYHKTEEDSG
jgi:hypothetical protein